MSYAKLILITVNEKLEIDRIKLANKLWRAGFLGDEFESFGEKHYLPGRRFLQYIKCKNAMEAIELVGILDGEPIYSIRNKIEQYLIQVTQAINEVEFLSGGNTIPPNCKYCQYEEKNWANVISEWYENKNAYFWICPLCSNKTSVYELDWKKRAGFGGFFIGICNIHEDEAYPVEELFETLKRFTSDKWTYFYYTL
ncbi:MAG: hypothetical protein AB1489_38510 [Acidobacteriota bacterium]